MSLAIIDSGGANINSVKHALRRLGTEPVFTADAAIIRNANRVILPGVGAAGAAMSRLRELDLLGCIRELRQPVLGICLGMQLLFERSDEGAVECLGIIPGKLQKLQASDGLRVPHMGWNTTKAVREDPLLNGLPEDPWFYFVHSYFGRCATPKHEVGSCDYGISFTAAAATDNIFATQFHPEKSQHDGLKLIENFVSWNV